MYAAGYTDKLKAIIGRIVAGKQSGVDDSELHSALLSRQVVLAQGHRSVASSSISQSIVITGDTIFTGDVILYEGSEAAIVRQIVSQELAIIETDACQQSLLDYFRALRHHCANLPYLTLSALPG